jgi:hypothetical protein
MGQNIVSLTVFRRALRFFLASLFAAVVWVFVSAAASFAADPSPRVSDPVRPTQDVVQDGRQDRGPAAKRIGLPGPAAAEAVAKRVSAVTEPVEEAVFKEVVPAASLTNAPPAVEMTARKLTAAVPSTASSAASAVTAIAKPAAAVVDSVVRDGTAVLEPVLTRVVKPVLTSPVTLPADAVAGAVADPVAVDVRPSAGAASGAEQGAVPHPRGAFKPGVQQFLPYATAVSSAGASPQSPAGRSDAPPLPAAPPAGAEGTAGPGGSPTPQAAAATADVFDVPFNPASELTDRPDGQAPHALNRHPGFSPD